ncbi:hypothetical protein ABW20_dc0107927 [Dactylellina cionopaga]|nr:hypothetical protein ABW20_dc0107927 [Dactylellina cionopaga]
MPAKRRARTQSNRIDLLASDLQNLRTDNETANVRPTLRRGRKHNLSTPSKNLGNISPIIKPIYAPSEIATVGHEVDNSKSVRNSSGSVLLQAIFRKAQQLSPSAPPPSSLPSKVKTTFLLVSDTHNVSPSEADDRDSKFRQPFPHVDVFIHAGDITQSGSLPSLKRAISWIESIHADVKIIIAGNHDCRLDTNYWVSKANKTANDNSDDDGDQELEYLRESKRSRDFITSEELKRRGIYYLEDEVREFHLSNGAKFTVLASPYTPKGPSPHDKGSFRYTPTKNFWRDKFPLKVLPEQIQVVLTHGPAYGILDTVASSEGGGNVGCRQLLKLLRDVKPLLGVFGHIHEAAGVKIVEWEKVGRQGQRARMVERDIDYMIEMVEGASGELYNDASAASKGIIEGEETLFVNASLVGAGSSSYAEAVRCPYVVELELPYIQKAVKGGRMERQTLSSS